MSGAMLKSPSLLSEKLNLLSRLLFREDATVDDLIDVIEGNRKYMKCIYVYNKIDVIGIDDVDNLARQPNSVVISCNLMLNFDRLLAKMWEEMGLVRVYTKPQGQQPDFSDPVALSAVWGLLEFILLVFDFRIEVAALLKTSVITNIEVG
nr:isoform 2 of developmentally-regulated g-protein 2 [Quercus suber]